MTALSPKPDPHVLAYGRRQRRGLRRVVKPSVAIILLLLIVGGSYKYRVSINRWMIDVRLRHRVLVHTNPAGTVVMHQSASDTRASVNAGIAAGHYRTAPPDPIMLESAYRWDAIFPRTPPLRTNVLLHELTTSSGKLRAVAVDLTETFAGDATIPEIEVRLFDPGTLSHPLLGELLFQPDDSIALMHNIPMDGTRDLRVELAIVPFGKEFTLFAGRIDPGDPSRFFIDYIYDGKPGVFWGRFDDYDVFSMGTLDHQRLRLDFRFPPPKPRPQ